MAIVEGELQTRDYTDRDAVHGDAEGGYGHAALGVAQLRVGHEPSLEEDLVEHSQ